MNPNACARLALASLLCLIILGIAVELWLAPLRAHGSFLALKVVPLLLAVPGIYRRNLYTMQWSAMLVLLYLAEGLVSATSGHGPAARYGDLEIFLALVYFASTLAYVYPFKRRARAGPPDSME